MSSVRCVLFREAEVLVVHSTDGTDHILPGGRIESGETLDEALLREVMEETGYSIVRNKPLGFIHLHHLGPKPTDYAYPYPDAFQIVRLAEAGEHHPGHRQDGEWELGADFREIEDARRMMEIESRRARRILILPFLGAGSTTGNRCVYVMIALYGHRMSTAVTVPRKSAN